LSNKSNNFFYNAMQILILMQIYQEFHIYTDASNVVVGAMLAENPLGKYDQLICCTSRLLNFAECNYTTTKKEALAMVYALKKYRQYLLGNKFVFFIGHMVLVYLVNKLQVSWWIAKWLLLFLEYDFIVVYKLRKIHRVANALSQLSNGEPTSVDDQMADASFFSIQSMTPKWF
jgi:hypothetical protein